MVQTLKQVESGARNREAVISRCLSCLREFGSPLTCHGISDEAGYGEYYVRCVVIPALLDRGNIVLDEILDGYQTYRYIKG